MDERMSAAEVIAESLNTEIVGHSGDYNGGRLTYSRSLDLAIQGLDALREAGWAVIAVPEVAHKGPHDTDAKFYRQVADRMENPKCRFDDLSGGNVRNAVRELLYRAAAAVSQDGEK